MDHSVLIELYPRNCNSGPTSSIDVVDYMPKLDHANELFCLPLFIYNPEIAIITVS